MYLLTTDCGPNELSVPILDKRLDDKGVYLDDPDGRVLFVSHDEFLSGRAKVVQYTDLGETVTRKTVPSHGMTQGDTVPLFVVNEDEDEDHFSITNVPIFGTCDDPKRPKVNHAFLDAMVKNFQHYRDNVTKTFGDERFAWLPKVHVRHTRNNDDKELPIIAFVENLRRVGDFLHCDFTHLDKKTVDILRSGRFPDRSCEVDIKGQRLLSVAVLGASPPYFALPQMRRFDQTAAKRRVDRFALGTNEHIQEVRLKMPQTYAKWQVAAGDDLLALIEGEGFTFTGERTKLCDVVAQFKGGVDELFELIRKLLLDTKTRQMNNPAEGSGHGYPARHEIDDAELDKYVQSEGFKTACAKNTQPFMPQPYPVKKSTGVNKDGEPSKAPRHFTGVDTAKFVASFDDDKQKVAAQELVGKFEADLHDAKTFIGTQAVALENMKATLDAEVVKRQANEQNAAREHFRAELVVLKTQGCTSIGDVSSLEGHLDLLMKLDIEGREKYIAMLKAAPKITDRPKSAITPATFGASGANGNFTQQHAALFTQNADLRNRMGRLGVDEKHYALAAGWADMEEALGTAKQDMMTEGAEEEDTTMSITPG